MFSVAECKEKWKNIRNGFVRSLKTKCASGSSAKAKRNYYLADYLQFIVPYIKPVNHTRETGNLPNSENDCHSEELTQESPPEDEICNEIDEASQIHETIVRKRSQQIPEPPQLHEPKLRKRSRKTETGKEMNEVDMAFCKYLHTKSSNTEDSDRMFLLSLLCDMKKLSSKNVRRFKLQTMILLSSLIDEDDNSNSIVPNIHSNVPTNTVTSQAGSSSGYLQNSHCNAFSNMVPSLAGSFSGYLQNVHSNTPSNTVPSSARNSSGYLHNNHSNTTSNIVPSSAGSYSLTSPINYTIVNLDNQQADRVVADRTGMQDLQYDPLH